MIHCFTINSTNLVLDVNSGALHQVDDAVLSVLRSAEKVGVRWREVLNDEYKSISAGIGSEIDALVSRGQLFSPDDPASATAHMNTRRPVVKALCLHMAHECNLACVYCFAGQGSYSESDRGLMSLEVGKGALDFLVAHSGGRRNLEVDFFGGEPMLNFPVVKELVEYGRLLEADSGKKFRFTLTTNGALIDDEVIRYINKHMDNVVLSLDGRRDVNDRMRPRKGGGGSYDDILPKIKSLADERGHEKYYVRGTFTRHNLDFSLDVLHLAEAGFRHISVEPVVAPPCEDYALREEDLPTLYTEYENLAAELLKLERDGKGVNFFHFELELDGGPCVAKRVTGCGAGSEYLAVTPSGKLYPCHQFVGDEDFLIGDVWNGIKKTDVVKDFEACHVYNKSECAGCWARLYCSGGCMATAYHATGSILKSDAVSCDLMKKRVECALYVYAERRGIHGGSF